MFKIGNKIKSSKTGTIYLIYYDNDKRGYRLLDLDIFQPHWDVWEDLESLSETLSKFKLAESP